MDEGLREGAKDVEDGAEANEKEVEASPRRSRMPRLAALAPAWLFEAEPCGAFGLGEKHPSVEVPEQDAEPSSSQTNTGVRTETVHIGQVWDLYSCSALDEPFRQYLERSFSSCALDQEMFVRLQIGLPTHTLPLSIELALIKWHADIVQALAAFQKCVLAAMQGVAQGRELGVYAQVSVPKTPESLSLAISATSWDSTIVCQLKPGLPVLCAKILAAEHVYKDASRASSFEVRSRQKLNGEASSQGPLPVDMPLSQDLLELEACMLDRQSSGPPLTLQVTDASMMKLTVLLAHNEACKQEGYCPTIHAVRKGTRVVELKKAISSITGTSIHQFGICPATALPEKGIIVGRGDRSLLEDDEMLAEDCWLLQVCDRPRIAG